MDRLTELFIRDSKKYLSQATNSLINIEKKQNLQGNTEIAFRAVHSIKTESSYLQMTNTKDLSHEIENTLESFRSGELVPDKNACDMILGKIDELSRVIEKELEIKQEGLYEGKEKAVGRNNYDTPDRSADVQNTASENSMTSADFSVESDIENESEYYILEDNEDNTADEDDLFETAPVISGSVSASGLKNWNSSKVLPVRKEGIPDEIREEAGKEFSDFELQLISESMKRGEKLYMITCDISEKSVMKYPRLYLVINNLELKTNLIKTTPTSEELSENEYTSIKLYITTKKGYKEIYSIADVDEVENIQIINLPYSYYFRENEQPEPDNEKHKNELNTIPVKISRLDRLFVAVEGMKLDLALNRKNEAPDLKRRLLKNISVIEKNIKKLRMVSFSEEFQMLPGMIKKMGYDLGKDVDIEFNDNNIEIDRSLFEYIYDPLIHILKNSVDHGIEDSKTREKKEKSTKGNIFCSTSKENGKLVIEISDDGRGLDLNKISEVSGYDLSELAENENLIKVLTKPGFSTRKDASSLSGRGFGLNLVWEKIKKIPGADLKIISEKGSGLTVKIFMPDTFIASKVVFTKCRNEIVVINEDDISGLVALNIKNYRISKEGLLSYGKYPVYNKEGRVYSKGKYLPSLLTDGKAPVHGVIIKNGDRKGCFIADEILFSQVIPADRFFLLEREVPYLSYLRIAGMEKELSYLHSEILGY